MQHGRQMMPISGLSEDIRCSSLLALEKKQYTCPFPPLLANHATLAFEISFIWRSAPPKLCISKIHSRVGGIPISRKNSFDNSLPSFPVFQRQVIVLIGRHQRTNKLINIYNITIIIIM